MSIFRTLIILTSIILQFSSFQVVAQTDLKQDNITIILKENIIRLEEQNKILLSTTSDMRSSYHWALGFCATFLILFLGVNIYFFRNRFNEDKEFLLNKIEDKFKGAESSNLDLIKAEMSKFDKKLETSFKQKANELSKNYKASVASNLNKIQYLSVQVKDLELENTKANGCKPNILTGYFHLAEETHKLGSGFDWQLSECLVEARKLLDEGVEIESMEYPEVTTFLNSLPSQFNDVVEAIRKYLT